MNDQRHVALSNLFSSLSSLASNQAKLGPATEQVTLASQVPSASSSHLLSSVQNAMAAALFQQQLAASSLHQHQQQRAKLSTSSAHPINFQSTKPQTTNYPQPLELLRPPQPPQHQQHQQQQQPTQPVQRINYCTICNKELCNKYFMKTHMLKMHGINLSSEPAESGDDDQEDDNNADNQDEDDQRAGSGASEPESGERASDLSSSDKKRPKKGAAVTKKKSGAGQSKATSVMNGYAGNSMGGVVCDICNKELCSKYFLKVHKQNTHGVSSDYQESGHHQFIYPFAGEPAADPTQAICAQSVYHLAGSQPTSGGFYAPPPPQQQQPVTPGNQRPLKKQRLSPATLLQQTPLADDDIEKKGGVMEQQFRSIYRLLLAQQQHAASGAAPPPAPQAAPAQALNSLAACFGAAATNPFAMSAAVMSPAMVVDNILRNQHVFKRSQPPPLAPNQVGAKKPASQLDGNNNAANSKRKDSAAANSRYFSHYTEACPMCDRRFKSIKWLKTHMMNDHKQEIAGYMQAMMQYSYANKSQQLAAAATMAALERQRHDLLLGQQLSAAAAGSPFNPATFERCFDATPIGFRSQLQPTQLNSSAPAPGASHRVEPLQFPVELETDAGSVLDVDQVIDARCASKMDESSASFASAPLYRHSPLQVASLDQKQQQQQLGAHLNLASGLGLQLGPLPAKQLHCSDVEEEEEEEESEEEANT